jgi:hypothetical protein
MNFAQWNEVLGNTFLNEGPNRPVYFSATEAELQQMNDGLHLGLADPVEDLRAAVRPYSFLSFDNMHRRWELSKSKALPPWLPFLAVTTLIVDEQTERGSTRFYDPLSAFLGYSRRISQHEYESTFRVWWPALKRWLEHEDRHAGQRGFATWGAIPEVGPRSVIGHPYTQVLLRRDERRQIDDFLAEFDHLDSEPPTARDRHAVADQLVDALRRWARDRRAVSGRLRRILEGNDANETLSLGYVLLDRLFEELSGQQRGENSARVVRLVPGYDDYERILRLVAIAPNWVRSTKPVVVPHADDALREPGDAVSVDVSVTSELLREGIEFGSDPVTRLVGCQRYVMAAREWALWCTVEGALPDEELHMLLEAADARRFGLRAITGVQELPTGWAMCGPMKLHELPAPLAESAAASARQLVPRLRGGLRLQNQIYLQGGEPRLELAGFDGEVTVDGAPHLAEGDGVSLSALDLEAGEHRIAIGGFDLPFHTVQSLQPVDIRPILGRDDAGVVVQIGEGTLITGARQFPDTRPVFHRGLVPHVPVFVKLGVPGEIGVVEGPLMAGWAQSAGLRHHAVEVHAKSAHPYGDRLVKRPQWIGWRSSNGTWVVAEIPWGSVDRDEDAPFNPRAWRDMCQQIGSDPEVHTTGAPPDTEADVLERWRTYCVSEVDG